MFWKYLWTLRATLTRKTFKSWSMIVSFSTHFERIHPSSISSYLHRKSCMRFRVRHSTAYCVVVRSLSPSPHQMNRHHSRRLMRRTGVCLMRPCLVDLMGWTRASLVMQRPGVVAHWRIGFLWRLSEPEHKCPGHWSGRSRRQRSWTSCQMHQSSSSTVSHNDGHTRIGHARNCRRDCRPGHLAHGQRNHIRVSPASNLVRGRQQRICSTLSAFYMCRPIRPLAGRSSYRQVADHRRAYNCSHTHDVVTPRIVDCSGRRAASNLNTYWRHYPLRVSPPSSWGAIRSHVGCGAVPGLTTGTTPWGWFRTPIHI